MHDFAVSAQDGKLAVKAKKTVLVDLKVAAVASLRIVDERQLWIDVESVDVMGGGGEEPRAGPDRQDQPRARRGRPPLGRALGVGHGRGRQGRPARHCRAALN